MKNLKTMNDKHIDEDIMATAKRMKERALKMRDSNNNPSQHELDANHRDSVDLFWYIYNSIQNKNKPNEV